MIEEQIHAQIHAMHKYMHIHACINIPTHAQTHNILIELPNYYKITLTQINIKLTTTRFAAHRRRL